MSDPVLSLASAQARLRDAASALEAAAEACELSGRAAKLEALKLRKVVIDIWGCEPSEVALREKALKELEAGTPPARIALAAPSLSDKQEVAEVPEL